VYSLTLNFREQSWVLTFEGRLHEKCSKVNDITKRERNMLVQVINVLRRVNYVQ
jgi:hypothetical protein